MRGTLPDMFSDSDRYIKLLNIYRNKAGQDADQVYRRVQTHLESIGKSPVSNLNFLKSIHTLKNYNFVDIKKCLASRIVSVNLTNLE